MKCFQGLIQLGCSPTANHSAIHLSLLLTYSPSLSFILCSFIRLSITINELFCRTAHQSQARSAVPFALHILHFTFVVPLSLSPSLLLSHTLFCAPHSRMTSMRLAIYNLRFKENPFGSVASCPILCRPVPYWQGH